MQRSGVDPEAIDQLVFGQVVPTLLAPSIAREVVLASALPRTIETHTVARACATSLQALTDVAAALAVIAVHGVSLIGDLASRAQSVLALSPRLREDIAKADARMASKGGAQ